jgi:hypothetical protein
VAARGGAIVARGAGARGKMRATPLIARPTPQGRLDDVT